MEYETELPYPLTTLKCSWGNDTGPKYFGPKTVYQRVKQFESNKNDPAIIQLY